MMTQSTVSLPGLLTVSLPVAAALWTGAVLLTLAAGYSCGALYRRWKDGRDAAPPVSGQAPASPGPVDAGGQVAVKGGGGRLPVKR